MRVAVGLLVLLVLAGCTPTYYVQLVSVIPNGRISVSCSSSSGSRKIVVLPLSAARSTHVGDRCPA